MKIFRLIKQSLVSLLANKARSFLTTLGIIIGIGSVIGLVALGNGVQEAIKDEITTLGSTTINIVSGGGFTRATRVTSGQSNRPQQPTSQSQSLTKNDLISLETLALSSENFNRVAGTVNSSSVIKFNEIELLSSVVGISPQYFDLTNIKKSKGEFFTDRETNKAVLGSKLAIELFGEEDPLNKVIQIKNVDFIVGGVLEEQEENSFSTNSQNYTALISDYQIFNLLDATNYSSLIAKAKSDETIKNAKQEITNILLTNHKIDSEDAADFTVITPEELLSVVGQITGLLTSLLAGIAAISLLVGGIGIMNIMLVSVTERTREIGLRKAVGATTRDILIQFLIEAILLTVLGGIIGIILGYLISQVVGSALGFVGIITVDSVLLAVGVSSIIGIIFGIYPAAKASRLNPIDALRYE